MIRSLFAPLIPRPARKGISLIETLFAVTLGAALLVLMAELFVQTQRLYYTETNRTQLQASAETVLSRMSEMIRQGVQIESVYGGYETSGTSLIVAVPIMTDAATIPPQTYDYFIFRLNPTKSTELEEIVIASPLSQRQSRTRTLIDKIASFQLTFYTPNNTLATANTLTQTKQIHTQLILESARSNRITAILHSETAVLRNR